MRKHTILFLAANPVGADRLALDEEARAIHRALERSGHRDQFQLETRWAARPLDLLEELRKLKPTIVHFSGHGGSSDRRPAVGVRRDLGGETDNGLFFQAPDGGPRFVSTAAIAETFGAAGASVKLVVLNACYSEVQAEALLTHLGCVVGMRGSIGDSAARSFAIGFYGGIGERESVAAAYRQGCAAIGLEGLPDGQKPQLRVREPVDAELLVLAQPGRDPASETAVIAFKLHCGLAQLQFGAKNPGILRWSQKEIRAAVLRGVRLQGLLADDDDSAIRALSPGALSSRVLRETERRLASLMPVARLAQAATIRLLYRGTSIEDSDRKEVMALELTTKVCADEIGIPEDSFWKWHKSQFAEDANPQLIIQRLEDLVRAAVRGSINPSAA